MAGRVGEKALIAGGGAWNLSGMGGEMLVPRGVEILGAEPALKGARALLDEVIKEGGRFHVPLNGRVGTEARCTVLECDLAGANVARLYEDFKALFKKGSDVPASAGRALVLGAGISRDVKLAEEGYKILVAAAVGEVDDAVMEALLKVAGVSAGDGGAARGDGETGVGPARDVVEKWVADGGLVDGEAAPVLSRFIDTLELKELLADLA
ncbi:hypothetical protein HK101_003383 [Irineochytrium annulatum]|nr:hypothetical protein HK101_003383 [Irineochytrium annulatum]